MHAQAQGVAIFKRLVAADADHTLAGCLREEDDIPAIRMLHVAAFDCAWDAETSSNVEEFDSYLTAVPRIHALSP